MYSENKDYCDEYVSNGLEEEVNYDRFHQKGRNTNKRKLKSQKSFKQQRKYEEKYRNNVRKNDRDSKIYENRGFAIEKQQKALIEHIKKQEQHIETEIETRKREKQLKKIEKFQNDMNRIIREKDFNGKKKMKAFKKKKREEKRIQKLCEQNEDKFDKKQKSKEKKFKKKKRPDNAKKYKKEQRKQKDIERKTTQYMKQMDKKPMEKQFFIGGKEALIGDFDSNDEVPFMDTIDYIAYRTRRWEQWDYFDTLDYDEYDEGINVKIEKDRKEQEEQEEIWEQEEIIKKDKKKQIIMSGKELVKTKRRLVRKLNRQVDLYLKIEERCGKVLQDQRLIRIEIEETCHKQQLNMELFAQVNDNYYDRHVDKDYYSREMNTYNQILELGYTNEYEYDNY